MNEQNQITPHQIHTVPYKNSARKKLRKVQLEINKSEKNSSVFLKMRKLTSKIQMLNYPILENQWVNTIQKTVLILQMSRTLKGKKCQS